ncbi:hypothetical protein VHEMI03063 [[Torrubiella] hemipterigena]|uniref:NmrA-like domain-containing protein n=1 Tax=[Torrubiella] hemipterigena TaxID=1531966 RepID=A0A0A1SXH2_9HYPO|nr:hypothetical protein VHEMI03063 [[Torrubiella] hemipterigena]
MTFNRIAIYGHRGWASSAITKSLIASGAPIKILHRPESDVSGVPSTVTTVSVDVNDKDALIHALHDVDILISLVGHDGISRQLALVAALPHTDVKLFVPSNMSHQIDEDGMRLAVNKAKVEVEKAARDAKIAVTTVLPGYLVESSLAIPMMGVDANNNHILFTGNSQQQPLNLCTLRYVAAAYSAIFATTPTDTLQNRVIGLAELIVTGDEIRAALEQKHGAKPQEFVMSIDTVDRKLDETLAAGSPLAAMWYYRKIWATGALKGLVGDDIWEIDGYPKTTLDELLVQGKMQPYRELPERVIQIMAQFD